MFPVGLTDLSAIKYKKDILPFQVRCLFGAVSQIRTGDLILTKDALYLLSYNSVPRSLSIIYNNRQNVKRFFKKIKYFLLPCYTLKIREIIRSSHTKTNYRQYINTQFTVTRQKQTKRYQIFHRRRNQEPPNGGQS